MAVSASIFFKQGVSSGSAGQSLRGTTGTSVDVSNIDDTDVRRWIITLLDVPFGSGLKRGTLLDSTSINHIAFVPDVPGNYPVKLEVRDDTGLLTSSDARDFIAGTSRGWILPAADDPAATPSQGGNTESAQRALILALKDISENALFLDAAQGAAPGDSIVWDGTAWIDTQSGNSLQAVDSSSSPVSIGDAVVVIRGKVQRIASATEKFAGVARTAGTANQQIFVQTNGVVPASVTGLPSGAVGTVVVDPTTGRLARLMPDDPLHAKRAVEDGGQIVVGICDTSGDVVIIPRSWGCSTPKFVVNVKNLGAVGDGSTDDTVAVQNAINTAGSWNGAALRGSGLGQEQLYEVYFPRGVYNVHTLYVGSYIHLTGDHGAFIQAIDNSEDLVRMAGYFNRISNIGLAGGKRSVSVFASDSGGLGQLGSGPTNEGLSLVVSNVYFRLPKEVAIYQDITGRSATLCADANAGDTTIHVTNISGYASRAVVRLEGGTPETVVVQSVSAGASTITFAGPLAHNHPSGSYVCLNGYNRPSAGTLIVTDCQMETPAAVWGGWDHAIIDAINLNWDTTQGYATDGLTGFPLACFTSTALMSITNLDATPIHNLEVGRQAAWFSGITINADNNRLGGESVAGMWRSTTTMNYNGLSASLDPGTAPSFYSSRSSYASTNQVPWIEIYDIFPLVIDVRSTLPSTALVSGVTASAYEHNTDYGIFIDSRVDMAELAGRGPNACRINIEGVNHPFLSYLFRQADVSARRDPAIGTVVTGLLRQFMTPSAFAGSPDTVQLGVPSLLPRNNLWFSGHYDAGAQATFNGPIGVSGSDSSTGHTLTGFMATADGQYLNIGLHANDGNSGKWGTGVAPGEYVLSLFVKSNKPMEFTISNNRPSTAQAFWPRHHPGDNTYIRYSIPFHYDGSTEPEFFFNTFTVANGTHFYVGLFSIHAGTNASPFTSPVDNFSTPKVNVTQEDRVTCDYLGTSRVPPASGNYYKGDTYTVTTPRFDATNKFVCTTNAPTAPRWAPYGGSKLVLNVKDYGAKGDGSTHPSDVDAETKAIQAAIDDANRLATQPSQTFGGAGVFGEYVVHFPNGTYCINTVYCYAYTTITLDSWAAIVGQDNCKATISIAGQFNIIQGGSIKGGRWSVACFQYIPKDPDRYYGGGFFTGSPSNGGLGLTIRDCNLGNNNGAPLLYLDDTARFAHLTAGSSAGANVIHLSEVPSFVSSGAQLFVETSTGTYVKEVVIVQSVAGNDVTLSENLTNSFSANDYVGYAPNDRASAAQFLIENCELDSPCILVGGSNNVVFRDCYWQFHYAFSFVDRAVSAGATTIHVTTTAGIQPKDRLTFGGPSVRSNPDGFNLETLTVQSTTSDTITFTTPLVYDHRQAGVDEALCKAQETDDRLGFVLPGILAAGSTQMLLDNVAGAPDTPPFDHQWAWVCGNGDFKFNNVRFGGESLGTVFRSMVTIQYNRHRSEQDTGVDINLHLDKCDISSTARVNLIECFDRIPQRLSITNDMGNEAATPRAYLSIPPLTFGIWMDESSIDLSVFTTQNANFPVHNIEILGEFNIGLKYRKSSLANRCFPGASTDVTDILSTWSRAAHYNQSQITNQIGYPGSVAKQNLFFSGIYDIQQLAASGSCNIVAHGDTESTTGYPLTIYTASADGYLAPIPSPINLDQPTQLLITLRGGTDPRWGFALPPGIYTFSIYAWATATVGFSITTAPVGVGGGQRFPWITTANQYRRVWFPFYFDGHNLPSFTLVTENTIRNGVKMAFGLIMINEGSEPAPYVFPVDDPVKPSKNQTIQGGVKQVYYGSSGSPPSNGNYRKGDRYVVQPPAADQVNEYLCTTDGEPPMWVPSVTQTASSFMGLGTNPASKGALRLPNSTSAIEIRNGSNSGDLRVLYIDSSNNVALFDNMQAMTVLYAGGGLNLIDASNFVLKFSGGAIRLSGTPVMSLQSDEGTALEVFVNQRTVDAAPSVLVLAAGSAKPGATAHKDGADLQLYPGAAAAGGTNGYVDFENAQITSEGLACDTTLKVKINGRVYKLLAHT